MLVLLLLACAARQEPTPAPPEAAAPAPAAAPVGPTCTLLSINDTYRIEPNADGTGGMARVRTLRKQLEAEGDVLLLHAGDFLYPSLMSRIYDGAQMVEALGALDGAPEAEDPRMFVVFGNHEFDAGKEKHAVRLAQTIATSGFTWLGTNVRFKEYGPGPHTRNLAESAVVDCGGLRVGVFGVTTSKKGADYIYRFGDPVETARGWTAKLRAQADVVVALTHQSVDEDAAMLRALGNEGPDLVIGGHEHDARREEVDGRPIFKADADAHSAWTVRLWRAESGALVRAEQLVELDASIPEDPAVKAIVDARIAQHDKDFCGARGEPAGCLAAEVGRTTVPLVAAELDIRRFETNLGSWIADQARAAFPDAQIALVNSGSLRLNRDIAAGPIRRQDIEETFAYPMPLVRIEIDGATLEKVLARAVEEWTGNGHWLQVSGFAWAHDPAAGTASRATLLSTGKRIAPTDKLVAVVPAYLVDPTTDRDGYTMLPAVPNPTGPDLKKLVLDALAAKPDGIAPAVEGRICNDPEFPDLVCLAKP